MIALASGRRCPDDEQSSEGPRAGSASLCSFIFRIVEFTAFGTPRPVLAMTRSKCILVIVVLAGWFVEAFVSDKFLRFASAVLYSLAILILALSARRTRNADPAVRFGTEYFFLRAPPALAAIISVDAVIVDLKRRNFCTIIDCFSLNGFLRFHLPEFVFDFAAISLRIYAIALLAILLVRFIQVIQKSVEGGADGRISTKRERSEKRDTQ